ncbi:MAG: M24 family metallopeptidase [Pyrinomonadaceae bacterium]
MSGEIEEKTERLVRLCSQENLGGVLINSQPNFAWLTAGGKNGVDSSRENGVATLFVRADGKRFVLANKIEMERIRTEELNGEDYEPLAFGWEEEKGNPALITQLARSVMTEGVSLGCDLPLGDARLIEGDIARTRYQLTASEMDRFKSLGRDAGQAIGELARSLSPGVTEREVARRANDALAAIGADAVVTLVAADERLKRFRHPLPKDAQWKKAIMIVVCARRNGLIASLTRLVCAGPVPDELSRRTRAAAHVNAELFGATRLGVTGRELYEVAERAYRAEGFPGEEKLHHQGGAAGYRSRDWVAHPRCADAVQQNQAFAWNPSITGAKVEETIIAFEDHIEVITSTPGWPSIPIEVDGRAYVFPDVLSL